MIFVCVVVYVVVFAIFENFLLQKSFVSIFAVSTTMIENFVITIDVESSLLQNFFDSSFLLQKSFDSKKFFANSEIEKFFAIVASSSTKIILFNDVIIHNFEIVDFFAKIVEKFSVLWNDIEFVKLSKKN